MVFNCLCDIRILFRYFFTSFFYFTNLVCTFVCELKCLMNHFETMQAPLYVDVYLT